MDRFRQELDRLVNEHSFIPFYWNNDPCQPDARSRKEYPNYSLNCCGIRRLLEPHNCKTEIENWIRDECRLALSEVRLNHIHTILMKGYERGYRVHDMRELLEQYYPFCEYITDCRKNHTEDTARNFMNSLKEDEWTILALDDISGAEYKLPDESGEVLSYTLDTIKARNAEEAVYEAVHQLHDTIGHDMAFFITEGYDIYLDDNSFEILGSEDEYIPGRNMKERNGRPVYIRLHKFSAINKRTGFCYKVKNPNFIKQTISSIFPQG